MDSKLFQFKTTQVLGLKSIQSQNKFIYRAHFLFRALNIKKCKNLKTNILIAKGPSHPKLPTQVFSLICLIRSWSCLVEARHLHLSSGAPRRDIILMGVLRWPHLPHVSMLTLRYNAIPRIMLLASLKCRFIKLKKKLQNTLQAWNLNLKSN